MRTTSTEAHPSEALQMDEIIDQPALEANPTPAMRCLRKPGLFLMLLAGIGSLLLMGYLGDGGSAAGIATVLVIAASAATGMFSPSTFRV